MKKFLQKLGLGRKISNKQFDSLDASKRLLIKEITKRRLTYLSTEKLASIANSCLEVEANDIPGKFIEAGCALGGSSILISKSKTKNRWFGVYDVFGMIPPPTEEDTDDVHERYKTISEGKSKGIAGDTYYGYQENLIKKVESNLESFGLDIKRDSIHLIKGLLQETLIVNEPVAFAHIDVDWYDPVKNCLEKIAPHLSVGGYIILDDYHDWGGCKKATDEYLEKNKGQFELDDTAGSLRLRKTNVPSTAKLSD